MEKSFVSNVVKWFEGSARVFPWRKNPSPYFVWIAEVMSQQTVIAALLAYFDRFTRRFPTLHDLATASEQDVLSQWAGLGYYSRARNLHRAAKTLNEQWLGQKGRYPNTAEEWRTLPGVGPYTSAAIAAQCFNERVVVWDGNVSRVASRYFGESKPYTNDFREKCLGFLTAALVDSDESSSHFNQGLMELGALICTPQNPKCGECPLRAGCYARINELQDIIPEPKPRKEFVSLQAKVFIIVKNHAGKKSVLMMKRAKGKWYSGLYDFPTELGGAKAPLNKLDVLTLMPAVQAKFSAKHTITHHKIELLPEVYLLDEFNDEEADRFGPQWIWVSIQELNSELTDLPIATTAKKVMKNLFGGSFDFEKVV